MMELLRSVSRAVGVYGILRRVYDFIRGNYLKDYFLKFFLPFNERRVFIDTFDPVRYGAIFLAVRRIEQEKIPGCFAEVGIYQGYTSGFIHKHVPGRTFYLFDTFEGFPTQDLKGSTDTRFRTTNLEIAKRMIGDLNNIVFRIGYFPATANGLEHEQFAFVMLDVDLYDPTLAGLEFFYPRMNPSGYIFVHDYNSPESDYGVSRAVNTFMKDKPEKLVELPDIAGSVIIRKK